MFVLENDFIVSLICSKIEDFAENGVSFHNFEEFVSNLPIVLINSLPKSAKSTLGYYFNSYSYELYSENFYNCYKFLSDYE